MCVARRLHALKYSRTVEVQRHNWLLSLRVDSDLLLLLLDCFCCCSYYFFFSLISYTTFMLVFEIKSVGCTCTHSILMHVFPFTFFLLSINKNPIEHEKKKLMQIRFYSVQMCKNHCTRRIRKKNIKKTETTTKKQTVMQVKRKNILRLHLNKIIKGNCN